MMAFKGARVLAECLSSHAGREFYGFNSCGAAAAAAAQLKMHHVKLNSESDTHEEELCLFSFCLGVFSPPIEASVRSITCVFG